MNSVCLMGRLIADPDYSTSSTGTNIARYTLAIDRPTNKETGEKSADFPRCVCFGKTADFAKNFLKKGQKIAIRGKIQTGSYEKDGVKHYTFDIVVNEHYFCDSKNSAASAPATDPADDLAGFTDISEDVIPF